jgi:hypothetical protein
MHIYKGKNSVEDVNNYAASDISLLHNNVELTFLYIFVPIQSYMNLKNIRIGPGAVM